MQRRQNGWKLTDKGEFVRAIIAALLVLASTWVYRKYHPPPSAPLTCIGIRIEDFLERIDTSCKVDKGALIWVHSDGKELIVERIEEK